MYCFVVDASAFFQYFIYRSNVTGDALWWCLGALIARRAMIPFVGPLDLARGIFAIFTFSSHWPHRIVADLDLRCWSVGDGESPNYETRYEEEHWFGHIRKHGHVWVDVGTGRLQLNGSVWKSSSRGTCTMR